MIPAEIQVRLERQQEIDRLMQQYQGASWAYFKALEKGSNRLKQIEQTMNTLAAQIQEARG